ncbi:hypothetical protein LPB140_06170 [Sphingorhabdus lutea]|uniref:Sugar transporter n=1 Tax=Sphingorhabdus lutea TaxID=1913578 RepID=A0A1L3JBC6_9SPHN|nr:hypothetical protein [Sphingorhabdus lutea]APG62444.1 hypothetical protein LPB140_06170 [Sphingorhabdus lutea]
MTKFEVKPPVIFWVVASILTLWNIMGITAYLMDMMTSKDAIASMDEMTQHFASKQSLWSLSAYAIAVWAGMAGAISLLIRRKFALTAYIISFIGVMVQQYWIWFVADGQKYMVGANIIMPILVVGFAIFSIWFARQSADKGYLK